MLGVSPERKSIMPLTQLYQQVENSVVQVLALNGQNPVSFGSGSIINDGKCVLTCAHCIVQGAQMAIANPSVPGQALFGNVLFSDTSADIALLEFAQKIGPPVTLENSSSCAVGKVMVRVS
jgi:Trypsin-like peptidase domain